MFNLITHLKLNDMIVKNFFKNALIVLCIGLTLPATSFALNPGNVVISSPAHNPAATDPMVRLQQIKNMDKTNLSKAEKKELRKEVKKIKQEVRASRNGIYLSLGAAVIIILLLLLLL